MGGTSGEFTPLDWIVLAGYLVAITAFGLWVSRKIRSSRGYFLGDRKLPWWVMIGQSFGTGTHAENPVAQAGATYHFGFATIWYQWKNMLITPFYWLMAPWYRRCDRTTIGEMMLDRYGRGMAMLYTVFALFYFAFNQGTMLKGAGKAIAVATGGQLAVFGGVVEITPNTVVAAMAVTFILYSFFGGLVASAYTDFVQGFLIIAMSFLLIPAGLWAVGGFSGMRASLPEDFFELYSEASGVGAFTILMLTLNGLIGITAQPHTLSMNATGRTERAGRVGQTYGSMVKRFCTIGWALTGLIVAAMVVQRGATIGDDKESAFGYACLHLLAPGLTGLMVACILAANMSTCSNFMVNSGALFTRNLYADYVRPGAGDRELLLVGRLSGFALTVAGVAFAFQVGQVLDAFMFNETIPAFLGIAVMGGILWKGANRYGALAAVGVSLAAYYALNYLLTCPWQGRSPTGMTEAFGFLLGAWQQGQLGAFLGGGTLKLVYTWLAAPYAWATLVGVVVFVVVSLLTRPEDKERIERFFENMRRSTDREGLAEGQPKPPAAEVGQDLMLLDLPGWLSARRWRGFFRRYREDLVGFVLAWGAVGLLVLAAWGLMQIGT